MNWIEVAGFVLTIVGVFLSIYQSVWVWPVNILSPIVYVVLFYNSRLYGDMSLQILFIVLAVYGGFQWSKQEMRPKKAVRFLRPKEYLFYVPLTLVLFWIVYYILKNYTKTDVACFDAILTATSITATILAARKCIENWIIWILTDIAYVFLLIKKDLHLTAFLYGLIAAMAVYGLYTWRKEWKSQ
ncbi:MAG: pnuC [Bacteroidetes bacterium]|jgi:nicotinamide mononucleotide transporter|nr:pnuC [Bacteroidota bacterium]